MRICVIHTGGTIGSGPTPDGFAPVAGLVEQCLADLANQGRIASEYDIVGADPLIDSSQATVADWNWIAAAVADRHAHYDGFVVTHGTDTLAYSAAALALALDGLARPVVITGSMLTLSEAGNDVAQNLADAMAAARRAAPGVWVQFAGALLPGSAVQKVHSTDPAAFVAYRQIRSPRIKAPTLIRHVFEAKSIAVVTLSPGFDARLLRDIGGYADGVILRCFGSGNVPGDPAFCDALGDLDAREVPVLAISQCAAGGVVMGTYSAGAPLAKANAVDGRDLTLEAGYAKLMMGLSRFSGAALRNYLATPQCGEMGADRG